VARILLHAVVFPPDAVSTARLLGDLARQLHGLGHTIEVITTAPHYNPDLSLARAQPLRRVIPGLLYRSEHEAGRVWHVAIGRKRRSILARVLAFGVFHTVSSVLALVLVRRADVVLAVTPPPSVGVVGALAAWSAGVPMVYHVQELYPDFLVNQGYLRGERWIRLARWLQSRVYRWSATVVAITPGFADRLRAQGVPDEKLVTIENFRLDSDLPHAQVPSPEAAADGLVTYYGGNIGLSQDWELLLAAAEAVADLPVRFVVSGDGVRREWLVAEGARRGLTSLDVLGPQPLERLGELYATCDVVVVPMRPLTCLDTFPSKIYSIFHAGRPILAAADEDSDFARFIRDAGGGMVVAPGDLDAFVSALRDMAMDRTRLDAWGARGKAAADPYTARRCAMEFDGLIRGLTGEPVFRPHVVLDSQMDSSC
jgi:colanic acid biosynthesis glycosyl transferase WcaI